MQGRADPISLILRRGRGGVGTRADSAADRRVAGVTDPADYMSDALLPSAPAPLQATAASEPRRLLGAAEVRAQALAKPLPKTNVGFKLLEKMG